MRINRLLASSDVSSQFSVNCTNPMRGAFPERRFHGVENGRLPHHRFNLTKSGQHDRNPVTTKHENSREVRDNEGRRWRASPQYGNGASKEARKPGWSWTP